MQAGTDLQRALSRIAGGPTVAGNQVRVLRDAGENYPAWLEAIASAERVIHFENFIIADDMTGWVFADALAARARAGVTVRVLYDWLGSCFRASSSLWATLREAGVEVRAFNPPGLTSPLWIRRNHRKLVTVDGRIGFVSGLCVSDNWLGEPDGEPWRDTGVAIRGPAVGELDRAFAETWGAAGAPLAGEPVSANAPPAGDVNMRVVVGRPGQLSLYRLDLLVAASAKKTLWLTDAYFVPTAAYVQALGEAARDGVDVRVLIPGTSDVPGLRTLVQSGYRPLIEAGVRLFEWNGSMLHAKTAVADGRWSRVGSTNLNLSSWVTNWELDAVVEDEGFAGAMEAMFRRDLANATEVVLGRRRARRTGPRSRAASAAIGRLASAGAGLKGVVTAAAGGTRRLDAVEARSVALLGLAMMAIAAAITVFPVFLVSPVVIILAWMAVGLLARAWRARRSMRKRLAGVRPGRDKAASPAHPLRKAG